MHLKKRNYEWLKITFDPTLFPGFRIVTNQFKSTLFANMNRRGVRLHRGERRCGNLMYVKIGKWGKIPKKKKFYQ
jgi:hypothetical protein